MPPGLYSQAQYNANRTAGQKRRDQRAKHLQSLHTLAGPDVECRRAAADQGSGDREVQADPPACGRRADLSQPFTPFPLTAPDTTINAQGEPRVSFFTVPDNARVLPRAGPVGSQSAFSDRQGFRGYAITAPGMVTSIGRRREQFDHIGTARR